VSVHSHLLQSSRNKEVGSLNTKGDDLISLCRRIDPTPKF
jgi:hypothetical protein